MKRSLFCLTTILVCIACLALSACGERPSALTPQQKADAAVDATMTATADYTFAEGKADDALVLAREGDADMYIVAHADEGDKLIYVYQDVYYGEGEPQQNAYRYIDVYMPTAQEKLDPDTPVFLYLHGGGWVAGSRKEEQLSLMPYVASMGMVVVSMEYALWFGLNQMDITPLGVYGWQTYGMTQIINTVLANEHPVSVDDMMADITACITFLRDVYLPSLGLNATKIGIGGYSAGGHLSSLYAYKYAQESPMPLAYLMDLVGPVKLTDDNYMRLLDLLTGHTQDETGAIDDTLSFLQPMLADLAPALGGILGEDGPVDISTEEGYAQAIAKIHTYQPIDYLNADSLPTIICYARQHDHSPLAEALFQCEFDDFIPITVYQAISAKLDEVGVVHSDVLFDDLTHNSIGYSQKSDKWMATAIAAYASLYCD